MNEWVLMAIEVILIPAVMIILGWKYRKEPPKNKKSFFAYKTDRALLNEDTWAFAHQYIGRLWFWIGIVTVVITAIVMIIAFGKGERALNTAAGIMVLVHLIPLALPMVFTEQALKRTFDPFGDRIEPENKDS